ncbi:MAG: ABC transporter, substrate-binding protein (cluster 5, nickel/peptides/opines) [uncultured Acidimicrobiales bacterium]|uniref:ABC transporter, substrate-binding protein (Cluster 5, nickel/peptides/opines) n=1 Tax=uncultured Acidimicrobiales bacterium TaxID=310071 RepID=A0A6J4J3N2_9ACTN|nr:MAG: ABC transporter, substrate-binding protein (cluster 5, nickel/peptides/opines) [uncultured Acidimicrobiales bacterium]
MSHFSARLRLRAVALLAVTSLVVGACGSDGGGGSDDTALSDGPPKPGGRVVIGLEAETAGWQPGKDSAAESGASVNRAIYDTLLMRDRSGKMRPFLAESLETSDDLREWTVKLRPNIKFHDGTELNAAVLKDNFDKVLTATGARTRATLAGTTMIVVDPLTVRYTLERPNAAFADTLAGAAAMPFSMANYEARGADISAHPVGTGPFIFVSWVRDSQLVVKKNPNYWIQGLPHLDEVVFKPIPDEDARLASLQSGEIDMMHTLRQSLVKKAKDTAKGYGFEVYEFLGNNAGANIFNTGKPPLDDKRVRQALVHALDQEAAIEVLGGGGMVPPSTQLYSRDSPWYSEKAAATYPKKDVEKAKQLLASYVNDPSRSDRKAPGTPVSVRFDCPPDPSLVDLSLLTQQQWAAIGVRTELRQVEQSVHITEAVGTPPDYTADYDVKCWRLGSENDPDLGTAFGPPKGAAANVTDFSTPRLTELLERGRTTSEFEDRKKVYEEISILFNDEVPFSLGGPTLSIVAAKPYVRNVTEWTFPDRTTKGPPIAQSVITVRELWLNR